MSYQCNPIILLDNSNATGVGSGGSLTVGGGISIGKDMYVGGSVNISGTTTSFSDNVIILNKNPTSSVDIGILWERHTSDITNSNNYMGIMYSESADDLQFGYVTSDPGRSSVTMNSLARLKADSIVLTGVLATSVTSGSVCVTGNSNTLGNLLTTGGNIGIGKVPTYKLDVSGDINFSGDLYKNGSVYSVSGGGSSPWSTTGNNLYYLSGSVGINTSNPTTQLEVAGGGLFTSMTSGTINATSATIGTVRTTTNLLAIGNSNTVGNLYTTGGNVGIGNTAPSYALQVSGTVYASGDIAAFSDRRLKSDIQTINDALSKTQKLRGVYYTQTSNQRRGIGFIAQEIQEVIPEVVVTEGEYLGVAYGNVVGLLVEAIKELTNEVNQLKKQLL